MPTRRSPRSKKDVQENFNKVQDQEVNRSPVSDLEQTATQARTNQVREATKGFTLDSALQRVTQFSTDLNKTLGSLTEQINTKAQELQTLNEAVEITKQDLEELHGKEAILLTTGDLLAQHASEVERVTKEFESIDREYASRREDLIRSFNEDNLQRQRTWKQEENEYVYSRDLKRQQEQDAWKKTVEDTKRAEELRRQDLQRNWDQREAELKAKETEFAQLKADAAALPEKIKKIEEAEFKKGFNTATKEANQEKALLQKDFESYKALAASTEKSLLATVAGQVETINKLQSELQAAQERVSKIAEKALESASSEKAFGQLSALQANKNGESSVTRSKS